MTVSKAIKLAQQSLSKNVTLLDHARLTGDILIVVYSDMISDVAGIGKDHWEVRVDTYCGNRQLHSSIARSWFTKPGDSNGETKSKPTIRTTKSAKR